LEEFFPLVHEIRRQGVALRDLVTGGTTETKVMIREKLAGEAAKISAGLVIFAEVSGNAVLEQKLT